MNRLPGSVPLTIRIQLECNFESELPERQVKVLFSAPFHVFGQRVITEAINMSNWLIYVQHSQLIQNMLPNLESAADSEVQKDDVSSDKRDLIYSLDARRSA